MTEYYSPQDYVEAMWLILQQEKPDDFVIATGEMHSVRYRGKVLVYYYLNIMRILLLQEVCRGSFQVHQ